MRTVFLLLTGAIALTVLVAAVVTASICGPTALLQPMADGLCGASDQPVEVFRSFLMIGGAGVLALALLVRVFGRGRKP